MTHVMLLHITRIIKKKREFLGISQNEMAIKLNITLSGYTKIETAKIQPSLDTLIRIAEVLELSLDSLIFGLKKDGNFEKSVEDLYDYAISLQETDKSILKKFLEKLMNCLE